jgi:RHS repeat-associated protein
VLSNEATGERYRWVGENESARTRNLDDGYTTQNSRYNGRGVTLYGNGEAVAVSYSSSGGSRSMYMGKDIMGSVRSVTVDTGTLEHRYEYDAFGQPYKGDLTGGMNLGYSGKPYDTATGLYNYGYRDYKPQAARFTTVDPIRDGNNWYAYVNNDPVNWVDLWGLAEIFADDINGKPIAVKSGTDLKETATIVIQRNGNDAPFSDTLNINIGNQTLLQLPVQSTANISEPRLTNEYKGYTLDLGTYTGTLQEKSGTYLNAIKIEQPDFYIHPNLVTVSEKRDINEAKGKSNGPFYNEVSAGCQVLPFIAFDTLTSTLQGIGFQYNGTDTISVTIKSKSK